MTRRRIARQPDPKGSCSTSSERPVVRRNARAPLTWRRFASDVPMAFWAASKHRVGDELLDKAQAGFVHRVAVEQQVGRRSPKGLVEALVKGEAYGLVAQTVEQPKQARVRTWDGAGK